MLQRAASSAYSWWWASHIRTKQSKWLEQNLQDMEEKVQSTLKILEEDGDSFAKRAEMYYKKRPELIIFVEESYRAYRSLAERYDHLSTELQNANNTIASVFPEQVQFAMDDEDEDGTPGFQKKTPDVSKLNIPKVPKVPVKDLKGLLTSATKKLQPKKSKKVASITTVAKSGLSKPQALETIDKLQKEILALQTEKEFVKSSYDRGLAKYWEIEKQITEMQEKIENLQDEFGAGMVIEDDEARTVMAVAALKSCQKTLAQLQEKQERSAEEARAEREKIKDAREKFESLKDKFLPNQTDKKEAYFKGNFVEGEEKVKSASGEEGNATQARQELELLREKIKEHFEVGSGASLTVTELAEKIDELVNKVISLETAVTSQTALIKRISSETNELQAQLRSLEDEKATLINGTGNMSNKLREMEEKLHGLQDLNQGVEDQNTNLQTHFTEAHCNLDHLSEKLHSVKPDEELELTGLSETEKDSLGEVKLQKQIQEQEDARSHNDCFEKQQIVKPDEELKVIGPLEKEEGSLVEDRSLKDFKEQEETLKPSDSSEDTKDVKAEAGENIKEHDSKSSLGEVKLQKDFQGQEDARSHNDCFEKQQIVKPDEELKVTGPLKKEEGSLVEDRSLKDSKEQEETLKPSDSSEETRDVKAEVGENIKEHDSISSNQTEKLSDKCQDLKPQDKVDKQTSSQTVDNLLNIESQEEATGQEDEPNWQELFMNGLEGREKILLTEYTAVLRNYKEVKKKLSEVEKKTQDTVQLRELKSCNAMKDEEIRSLRQKISLLQTSFGEYQDLHEFRASDYKHTSNSLDDHNGAPRPTVKEDEDGIKVILIDQPQTVSVVEEKLRMNIDELLEENLDFWLRFSTSFHEVQKFESGVQDLQAEIMKLEEKTKKHEGSSSMKYSLKSDVRPLYKHLREIETELTVWLEKSVLLKDELQSRFSSLCNIQEEITKALKTSAEDEEFKFTSYQAAKFQGEVLNMKQENNKVADELQAGLDHVTTLQLEVEKTLAKLNEEFGLAGSRNSSNTQLKHSESRRSQVPLRSFIFGVKPKKQRPSLFSCMSPALHRKYHGLRPGV